MLKKEIIWREILYQAIKNKKYRFTQKDLANKFGFSFSTIFNALKIPRETGAIKVKSRFFEIIDKEKLLVIWGTQRKFFKDIIYQNSVDAPIKQIESELPGNVILTAYTAYAMLFQTIPADYDKVYVYSNQLEKIKKRFPQRKGYNNLIVLKPDPFLKNYGKVAPLPQIYVDLWNIREWYAAEFIKELKGKI